MFYWVLNEKFSGDINVNREFVYIKSLKIFILRSRWYHRNDSKFDIDIFRVASQLFLGRHDFRTYMSTSGQNRDLRLSPMFTVRSITEINVEPGKPLVTKENFIRSEELYSFWDIEITAKSFLYKQVRRIIGTLISAAVKKIDEKCIYEMLTIPSKSSWNSRIHIAPACGLYLRKVHYDDKDLYMPD